VLSREKERNRESGKEEAMKRQHAVEAFFKRRVIDNLIKVNECRAVNQVRRELIEQDQRQRRRVVAEICWEG